MTSFISGDAFLHLQECLRLEGANTALKRKIHQLEFEKNQLHSLIKRHIPNCQEEAASETPVKMQIEHHIEQVSESGKNVALAIDNEKPVIPRTFKPGENMSSVEHTGSYSNQIQGFAKRVCNFHKDDENESLHGAKNQVKYSDIGTDSEVQRGIQQASAYNVQWHEELGKIAAEKFIGTIEPGNPQPLIASIVIKQENEARKHCFEEEDAARTMLEIQHRIQPGNQRVQKPNNPTLG